MPKNCGLSVKINIGKKPAWCAKIMDAFFFFFCMCGLQIPDLSPMAEEAISQGGIRGLWSLLYICNYYIITTQNFWCYIWNTFSIWSYQMCNQTQCVCTPVHLVMRVEKTVDTPLSAGLYLLHHSWKSAWCIAIEWWKKVQFCTLLDCRLHLPII